MLPNFLIVGCARCGTSWLDQNLRHHPEIFLPRGIKEIHFFDRQHDRGVGWYKEFFKPAAGYSAVGEATPSYLYYPDVAHLISTTLPGVKLIAALRNPVERAYSHYRNIMAKAQPGDPSFGLTFEQKFAQNPRLITDGLYGKMLSSYLKVFSKNDFLILIYDDLIANPSAYLEKVYKFLNVDESFMAPVIENRVNATGNKLGKSRTAYLTSRLLMKLGLYKAAKGVENVNSKPAPSIGEATFSYLMEEYYERDILILQDILERDLGHWTVFSNANEQP